MRIFTLVGLLAGCISYAVVAQSTIGDSLRHLLQTSDGTQKADVLNEYGYYILSFDYEESRTIIQQAYDLSLKLSYKKGLCESLLYQGTIEDRIGKDSTANDFFRKALSLAHQMKDNQLSGRILTAIGIVDQHKNQLDSAESYYNRSYQFLKDSVNPLYLSFLYMRYGELRGLRNDRTGQLNYLKKGWEIRKRLSDPHPLVWAGANFANYYIDRGEYDEALYYITYTEKALGTDTTSEEASVIYRNKAVIYANKGEHKVALDLFAKARRFYERNPFQWNFVAVLMEIGVTQTEVSNFETGLKYFYQALRIAEANHFDQFVAQIHYRIARAYYFLEQINAAEEFAQKSLVYSKTHHHEADEAFVENLLGLIYLSKRQFDVSLAHFNRALELRQKNDNRTLVASTIGNIGEMYEEAGDFQKAEEYDLRALSMAEKANYALGKCYSYLALAKLYVKIHQYEKADHFHQVGEAFARKIHFNTAVMHFYKSQSELWRARNDYRKALAYAERYQALKDSLFNTNVENRILTLQYDFELDKKDNEIKILNQQRELQQGRLELQQAEINRQRKTIVVGILIFLTGGAATFLIFRLYKKVKRLNEEISERNEEIVAQSEELKEANEVLGDLNREISGQKAQIEEQTEELVMSNQTIARINENLEEKIKIRTSELKEAYRELDTFFYRSSHDFRRPLTTFMGLSEVAKLMIKEKSALELFEKVSETARNLDKMLVKLQSVSVAGNDDLIYNQIFFDDIIQSEIHQFQHEILKKKIHVTSRVDLKHPFYSYPVLVKNVVQNLLENAITFSGDVRPIIEIMVGGNDKEALLQVTDNGQGIDSLYLGRVFEMYFRANERSTGNGLGLYIVKKMVDKMHGRIELTSEVGKGTQVKVFLPSLSQ